MFWEDFTVVNHSRLALLPSYAHLSIIFNSFCWSLCHFLKLSELSPSGISLTALGRVQVSSGFFS